MNEKERVPRRVVPSHVALVTGPESGPEVVAYSRYLKQNLGRLFPTELVLNGTSLTRTPLFHLQQGLGSRLRGARRMSSRELYRVATVHEVSTEGPKPDFAALDGFDAAVVHSPLLQNLVAASTKTPVSLMPYGSYLFDPLARDDARRTLGLPADRKIVLSFRLSNRDDGTREVLPVAERMRDVLFVVCPNKHPPSIFGRAMRKRLPVNVIELAKPTEEQVNVYASAADVLLFPPGQDEGMVSVSGPLHRLLASKRPIVGSSGDPSLFEVEDGSASVQYEEGDSDSMEHALNSVLTDRDLASRLGEKARALALETSWEKVAKRHLDLYGKIIGDFFGMDWYDEEYYVGAHGGKEFYTGEKKEHWSYFNPQGEWTGARTVMRAMKAVLNPRELLSVGEGRGTFLAYASDVGMAAKGIDFSRWAVEHPYSRAKGMIEWGDARDLSKFPDDSFDVVFASDLMEHVYIDDLDRVIAEIQRVSRKWAFYNNGGTDLGTLPPMFIRKGELPPREIHGTAIAGHVILQPCGWWEEKLANEHWVLRRDLVAEFRSFVDKVDPRILGNWKCVIIVEKVQR